ncbi:MAG: pyridoxamine 5'-phosphate oxidase family protein [Gilvibacter sp.]
MARNYAEIAFTDAVKKLQEKHGSRSGYDRMEKNQVVDGLTINEVMFIRDRDSFYLASTGSTGYPYIQHRGGPKGFLKVLDTKRIGFIDFTGNKQYVSVGNIATNTKVSLIMVDYPRRARLKIYAKAKVVFLEEDPVLLDQLVLDEYKFKPERMIVFTIEAFDWNCPQHIIPRYTIDQINDVLASQKDYMTKLEAQVQTLQNKIKEL